MDKKETEKKAEVFIHKYEHFNVDTSHTNQYMKRWLKEQHFDPSIVDDSSYEPSAEVVKQASINKLIDGNANFQGQFDTIAGTTYTAPHASDIPLGRQKGVDMAELSQSIIAQQSDIVADAKKKAKRRQDAQENAQDFMKAVNELKTASESQ